MRGHHVVRAVLAWGTLVAVGCGSRTGLELLDDPRVAGGGDASEGAAPDAADPDADSDSSAGGDIGSADAGTTAQPDCKWCFPQFPHCVMIAGERNCCNGPGPYDGPGGSCLPIP